MFPNSFFFLACTPQTLLLPATIVLNAGSLSLYLLSGFGWLQGRSKELARETLSDKVRHFFKFLMHLSSSWQGFSPSSEVTPEQRLLIAAERVVAFPFC